MKKIKIGLMLNKVVTVLTGIYATQYNITDEAIPAKPPLIATNQKANLYKMYFIYEPHKLITALLW